VWLADGEKNFEAMFARFDTVDERNKRHPAPTAIQTDAALIRAAIIASRG